jgi:hypothetical protein
MPRIKIVSVPEGPGIPEEVRRGWIGVEFEAKGPISRPVQSALTPIEHHGVHKVYDVRSDVALQALKEKNQKSWEWFFKQYMLAPIFSFNAESCKEI